MPAKQTPTQEPRSVHSLALLTEGEAALLAAHRAAAGHVAPVLNAEQCSAVITDLTDLLSMALMESLVTQASIMARLKLADRMVQLQTA